MHMQKLKSVQNDMSPNRELKQHNWKKCSHFFFQKLGSRSASLLRGDTFASHARRGVGRVGQHQRVVRVFPTHPPLNGEKRRNK